MLPFSVSVSNRIPRDWRKKLFVKKTTVPCWLFFEKKRNMSHKYSPPKKVASCFHEYFYFPKKIYIIHPIQNPKWVRYFRKWWYPQTIHFNKVFHYNSSILGYPYFWKHPNRSSKTTMTSENLESDQLPSEIPSATKLCWANLSPRRCVLWLKKLGKTSHSSFDEMMIGGSRHNIYIYMYIYICIIPWTPRTYMFRGFYGKKNLVFRWPKPWFFMVGRGLMVRCSMYGLFTYIYHKCKPNVGKYTLGIYTYRYYLSP